LREWQEAEPVTQRRDVAQEKITITTRKSETLKYIADNPSFSLAALATAMGWTLNNGVPYKTRAFRVVQTLINDRLVKQTRSGRYKVTPAGDAVLMMNAEDDRDEAARQDAIRAYQHAALEE
jgi:predicted transcriptional regulator